MSYDALGTKGDDSDDRHWLMCMSYFDVVAVVRVGGTFVMLLEDELWRVH